ncbi:MAG: ornithine--oxo-acid transaminase [Caldilineales bacterium]|nr:ornithine--oxo-acid transaminase [Caldilineales bacterium]MDW8319615.1 ornithine--oxo-acid transaminase [Anaerolineae bacterium]
MNTREYIELENTYVANIYHPLEVVLERGEGVWVYDVEGKRYLDCLSAYSAVSQGHCHPRIVQALVEQAHRVTLTSRAFFNDQLGLFAKELCDLLGYDMMLPMNSGAEAVEVAVKTARKWGYEVKGVPDNQAEIIVCEGNFHGRTTTVISFSSEPKYKRHFGPLTPGFKFVPFGDKRALMDAVTPNTVAFLVEPIQGENGINVPPPGYLKFAETLCRRENVLLMADEIQVGLGRTGKMLCSEHDNVRPDVVILGKALSGGVYPVSAVLADRPILGLYKPGDHGSTFGGNPLGAAVARAALRVLVEERLAENAAVQGAYLMERLKRIESPYIKEVRGRGLLIGVEVTPEAGGARRFCEELARRGILAKETHGTVIRLAPPLIIKREQVDFIADTLEAVFHDIERQDQRVREPVLVAA